MRYGLNGYDAPEVLAEVKARGFKLLRFGLIGAADDPAMIPYVHSQGYQTLIIVRDGAQVREFGASLYLTDVELWNEPDGTVDGQIAPADYASLVPDFVRACEEIGARPWIGAISNLHARGLRWLSAMIRACGPLPVEVGVTVHRYPAGRSWTDPHAGFGSREEEVVALRAIIGSTRRFACSEFGYHTAPQIRSKYLPKSWPSNQWRWTDAEVAVQVAEEWRFWRRMGASFAVLYQLVDGPTDTREVRFGIRTIEGTWKPVADSIRVSED